MENKLTNSEIARVFAMYFGCQINANGKQLDFNHFKITDNYLMSFPRGYQMRGMPIDYPNLEIELKQDFVQLVLSPLSKISREHAKGIYEIFGITESEAGYDTSIEAIKNCCIRDGFTALSLFDFYGNISQVFQYLTQQGYALPLFFSLNHWANGKTAIELGIAIEKP